MPTRLSLKEICNDDLADFFRCYSSEKLMKSFGHKPVQSMDEIPVILNQNFEMRQRGEGIRYMARIRESNEFIGFITLKRYNAEHQRAEID